MDDFKRLHALLYREENARRGALEEEESLNTQVTVVISEIGTFEADKRFIRVNVKSHDRFNSLNVI